jgi:chromosome segregation ATPase
MTEKAAPKTRTRTETARAARGAAAVKKVAGLRPEALLGAITGLQTNLTTSLSALQGQVLDGIRQFEEVRLAVDAERARLAELHDVDETLLKLDEAQAQLAEAERAHAARVDELKQIRHREQEEYSYRLSVERRNDQDAYDRERAEREQDLTAREAAIKAAEEELATLRTTVSGIDARIKEEVGKAVGVERDRMTRDHNHELALLRKDAATAAAISAATAASLQAENKRLVEQFEGLNARLAEAEQRVATIASQALGAAATREAQAAKVIGEVGGRVGQR